MSYLEKVEKYHQVRVKELEANLALTHGELLTRKHLAQILDELTAEITPSYDFVWVQFRFEFSTVEQAREFTNKLLERLGVEKAEKEFEGYRNTPTWLYKITYKELNIKVFPAEPSEDCVPVAKVSSSTYWVCMKKQL